jgi:2-polyprenyl-6-methoxyphenol hydroxylase-like FAD-dependent oxidoreductase
MLSASPWDRRDYVAASYRRGRSFIAGDAAHQCSPTGGIGMHTGLEEIMNLAWKLTAMLEGWGGETLLASYEAERQPIAVRNVEYATRSYNALAAVPGLHKTDALAAWQASPAVATPSISSRNTATRARQSAHPMTRPHQRPRPRSSCHQPGRARVRRMPGSPMTARPSTCSAMVSCCCG